MTKKNEIKAILNTMEINEAIDLMESLGKELRRKNSIRINKKGFKDLLEMERPDLEILKSKDEQKN
jgi:hypothetical protein